MRRGWLLLLCIILFVWQPLNFVAELAATGPSLDMRGVRALAELMIDGAVAVLSVAAGWSLWVRVPHGPTLAVLALIGAAATGVQSLYWSVLPGQTKPGDELPLALAQVAHSAAWIAYLRRSRRVREMRP